MTPYSIALFLHLEGALALFMALGLEWMAVREIVAGALVGGAARTRGKADRRAVQARRGVAGS